MIVKSAYWSHPAAAAGVLALCTTAAVPMAHAGDYLFVGISRPPVTGKQCPKFDIVMKDFNTEIEARAERKEFYDAKNFVDKTAEVLKPGSVSLVYQYEVRSPSLFPNCVFTRYRIVTAPSYDEAIDRMNAHAKEFRKDIVSEPEIVKRWAPGGVTKVRRKYDDVVVTYTSTKIRSDAGRVVAHIRNPHQDKTARLFFRVNGQLLRTPVDVGPLSTATAVVGNEVRHFGAALQLVEPQSDKSVSDALLQWAKDKVKEEVTVEDGKMQEPAGIGVRG